MTNVQRKRERMTIMIISAVEKKMTIMTMEIVAIENDHNDKVM